MVGMHENTRFRANACGDNRCNQEKNGEYRGQPERHARSVKQESEKDSFISYENKLVFPVDCRDNLNKKYVFNSSNNFLYEFSISKKDKKISFTKLFELENINKTILMFGDPPDGIEKFEALIALGSKHCDENPGFLKDCIDRLSLTTNVFSPVVVVTVTSIGIQKM